MPLPITLYGNPILRQKGVKVTVFDHKLKELAEAMIDTMRAGEHARGIGLAAQQVGQAIMLCVIDITGRAGDMEFDYILDGKTPPINLIMPMALVNPVLKLDKSETETYNEGCLSFPQIYADVSRPTTLSCRYQDVEGNPHALICDGLLARVIQHEVDHLNGILFIDRMPKSTLKKLWPQLEESKSGQA